MTDKQIIKALECAEGIDLSCLECSYKTIAPFPECRLKCVKDARDLINRQKEEIERLEKEKQDIKDKYDCQQTVYYDLSDIIKEKCEQLKSAKSEAIKEFAELLCKGKVENDPVVIAVKAELKEMMEETNG